MSGQSNPGFSACKNQISVQCSERQSTALGEVEISRVIRRQTMLAAQRLNAAEYSIGGDLSQHHGKLHEVSKKRPHQAAGDSFSFFSYEKSVEDFMRPERGRNRRVSILEQGCNLLSGRGVLVRETPGQNDRRIQDELAHRRPSLIRSLISRPGNDNRCRLPKLASLSTDFAIRS